MRFELLADPGAVSPEELSEDLRTLPSWRADKALKYRRFIDQVLCVEAYVLLRRALETEFGLSGNPEFEYLEFGKPVLKYTGRGLVDDLPSLMSSELVPKGLSFTTDICPADGYVYTIASLK